MADGYEESSLVHLNVGGRKFSTTVGTLTQREPDSMLAAMFSGRHTLRQDKKGYVFIDRDGKLFRHVLNWLRDGDIPKLEVTQYAELLKEAKYYQLVGLTDELQAELLHTDKGESLNSDVTRADIMKYYIRGEHINLRGVNLSGIDLSGLNLSKVNFSYSCMRYVRFSNADIRDAKFNYVDAEGATFDNADLWDSTFYGANLRGASFVGSKGHRLFGASCVEDCSC
ncbi:FH protein interacting protein FIP2-like [Pyrus communis]|uniref:FH protein interacting protein FIP2-like n=1 Tax=Pyrus communis TaxID=23211 RepID=UPI0035C12541